MSLPRVAIQRPATMAMLCCAIVAPGIVSLARLPVDLRAAVETARVVIGGQLASPLVTLVLAPTVYMPFEGDLKGFRRVEATPAAAV